MRTNWTLPRIALSAALLSMVLVSCDATTFAPTEEPETAALRLHVNTSQSVVTGLTVEVSAADIDPPLLFNIPAVDGEASGTLRLPAGSDRQITLRGYDSFGAETHRGSELVDIVAGLNPPIQITLMPLRGDDEIPATLGGVVVAVSPTNDTVSVGEVVALTAAVIDSLGDTISTAVSWASLDPAVASVNSGGVVTGLASGTAEIVATHGQIGGSSLIHVAQSSLATECDAPAADWIWCDDFDQDRLAAYFEYDSGNGSFSRASGVGLAGSTAMQASFEQGQTSAGSLKLAFGATPDIYFDPVDAGTATYREIYWRFYLKNDADWVGGGGDKLSRATIFARSDWSQAMVAHVWSGGTNHDHLLADPASGTDEQGNLQASGYNDYTNFRWLGASATSTPLFDSAHVGRWYCVEARVRLNDAGQSNGTFELWIDGKAEVQQTDLNWVGSYDGYGINSIFLENFWNDGAPQSQARYLDNFVVSTQPIGCGTAADADSSVR